MERIVRKMKAVPIICLIIIVGIALSPISYASNEAADKTNTAKPLHLVSSFPEDNDASLQVENAGVKLFFDGNVIDDSVWSNNSKLLKMTTAKGKLVKTKAYSTKKAGTDYILVAVQEGQRLAANSNYILTIGAGLKSAEGQVLSEDIVLRFKTIDTSSNTNINMGMMALMVVGMILMTVISNKRKEKKEAESSNKKDKKINPYAEAKKKGKKVEDIVEKIDKDKAKKEAKRLKAKNKEAEDEDIVEEDDTPVYSREKLRKVSDGGSTYKSGRKAKAEKKAKQEAAKKNKGTTNPKNKKRKGKKK